MLHGIDTIREGSKRPLQDVDTDIICVLGTAFMDNANQPLPIRNYQDVARYAGKNLSDFTLCDALETILNESGGATIYMINVFDKTKHVTSETDKVFTPVAGKFTIDEVGVSEFSIADATVDVDYRLIDMIHSTVVELISDELLEMETISCSYSFADVSKVTDADVVGTVDENGNRTGSKAICTITQLYGDDVNIIIAPKYSETATVRDALVEIAEDMKARAYLDCPKGTKVNAAVSARLSGNLMCDSQNAFMALPYVYRYNQFMDKTELRPLSPVLAGLRVKLNQTADVATSIDNTKSNTIKGMEFPVEFILNKENTEANTLNSNGIATVINWKGSYRIWGARNCSYPSQTGIETFDCVIDTANFIEKTIEQGSFEFVGSKVTRAFIDNVLETIKAKFNSWKNLGIILDGDVWFDMALNSELDNGKIVFNYDFCPPGVAEHIRYNSYINVNYITTALTNE